MPGFSSRYQRYLDMPEEKFERAINDLSPSELVELQRVLAAQQDRLSKDGSDFQELVWWAAILFVILTAVLFAVQALANPAKIEGPVSHWRDGDTPVLIVDGERVPVRLWGLHAPEDGETGHEEATAFMERLVGSQVLECRLTDSMTWDRHEGTCFLNGQDIAAALIRAGLGRDCPYYSGGEYRDLETDAGRRLQLPRRPKSPGKPGSSSGIDLPRIRKTIARLRAGRSRATWRSGSASVLRSRSTGCAAWKIQ